VADRAAQNPETARFAPLVRDNARSAFTDAMTPVFWAAAGVALLTALLVLKFMPSRGDVVVHEAGHEPVVDTEPAEEAAPVAT